MPPVPKPPKLRQTEATDARAPVVRVPSFCHDAESSMARHIEATDLPEDIARTAEEQVTAGRFASVEDVVRAGVEAIATLEQKRAAVRAALQEGELSGVFEGDAFASVRAELGLTRQ